MRYGVCISTGSTTIRALVPSQFTAGFSLLITVIALSLSLPSRLVHPPENVSGGPAQNTGRVSHGCNLPRELPRDRVTHCPPNAESDGQTTNKNS